ncbi:ABC-F family ATP-binding cassette domain-containing protein [Martelella soudanensis]|uniref:ABC-F family ATP-binding cassette domain-containing protein n=1 Tax=unclassified Martelella TaxID=2629616 RepID=UPI0015DF96F7|nr:MULTISPECIES: ABC-F family ATP-binding cassette domain-containing protein [unclassified Martelella]
MHASITLYGLSYNTADGHTLFKDISAIFNTGLTGLIGRNGVGKTTLLKLISGALSPSSGSVDVTGRIAVLDQSVSTGEGETLATLFGIDAILAAIERAERGEADAEALAAIDWTAEERAAAALARLGLALPLSTPLARLSGGEITRARLAALAFGAPDFILLDEPTNNLDAAGREALIRFLEDFRGGALVVSHDRELLERMDAIIELTSLGMTRYGGNFSFFEAEKAAERLALEHDLRDAGKEARKTARTIRERAERKAKRDAKGRRLRESRGLPKMVLDGMKANAELTGARDRALSARQHDEAAAGLVSARAKVEVVVPFSVALARSGLAVGKRVAKAKRLTGGYPPAPPLFRDLSFDMRGPERVTVAGRNGAGKSTLLAILTGRLQPLGGSAGIYVHYALFDQTVSLLAPDQTVRDNFRRLNPDDDENSCRAALARFRFRADAALQSVSTLSGGERLRAGLAAAIGGNRPAELLILDEPTNHLDLDSLATLEAGLNGYDGAILVVSHDAMFRQRIGVTRTIDLDEYEP